VAGGKVLTHCGSVFFALKWLPLLLETRNFTKAEQEAFGEAHFHHIRYSDLRPVFLNKITRS
jgi:hypothetical protein